MTDKIIESKNKDGEEVKVKLKSPGPSEYRDSQIEYNKAFRAKKNRRKMTSLLRRLTLRKKCSKLVVSSLVKLKKLL